MRSNRTPDAFETAPTVVAPNPTAVPTPVEEEETKPAWYKPRPRALDLSPRDRKHLRDLIAYVGKVPAGQRPGAVARACRNVLNHFCKSTDLREAALAFLQAEAVRLDGEGQS
jgi:hypothetical protein